MDSSAALLGAGAVAAALLGGGLVVWRRRRMRAEPGSGPVGAAPRSAADRVRRGLAATRQKLGAQLEAALGQGHGTAASRLAELEEALVAADVGVRTAADIVARLRERAGRSAGLEEVRQALREELEALLQADPPPLPDRRPWVILVTGVNGVGKTTTIGKLAALHVAAGKRVLLVAADTFRAAAIDQLAVWAERSGAELIRQAPGANPAAVAFDGVKAAVARGVDLVLIDTAGRLHTSSNLMEELRKVRRVVERELPGAPHETLLVLDATTGQNAIAQAKTFGEALALTGVIVTKLDGTARGGVVFAVRREVGVPVRYIGIGEGVEDLRPFDAHQFVGSLLDAGPVEGASSRFP